MNRHYLILLVFLSLKLSAQDDRIILNGIIFSDSLAIDNVHIINKSSIEGTISDQNGAFTIPVQLNDTLMFSGLQYYLSEVIISI